MHADVRAGGGKKLRQLFLLEPDVAVSGGECYAGFTVRGLVDDDVRLIHGLFPETQAFIFRPFDKCFGDAAGQSAIVIM